MTALPPQNSPAAAHAEVACTAFAVILMTRKSTASANHALPAVPMTTRMRPSVKREGAFYNKAHRKNEKARPASGSLWGKSERFFSFWSTAVAAAVPRRVEVLQEMMSSCVPLNGWCCHAMDLVMNNDKHFMLLELFQSSALLLVHLKHCCRN